MKRKLGLAVLMGMLAIIGIGLAQAMEPIIPEPPIVYPEVFVLEGVALDELSLATQPVVFVRLRYGGSVYYHLIIGSENYKLKESGRYELGGTSVFRFESEEGFVLTIMVQRFQNGVGISGRFKDYLMTFKPRRVMFLRPRPVERIGIEEPLHGCEEVRAMKQVQVLEGPRESVLTQS
jgi:hypothetical protein